MSQRNVYDCDGCGRKEIVPVEVIVAVGWSSDPAGGPSSDDHEKAHLCEKCAAWAFGKLRSRVKLSYEDGKWLIGEIKARLRNAKNNPC